MPGRNSPAINLRLPLLDSARKFFFVAVAALLSPAFSDAQAASPNSAPSPGCPVQFLRFNPSSVSVKIRNSSGKKIVGLVFNAALADATEHWKWYHWNFDETRPIRDFGWNKQIADGQVKSLTWYNADIDFEHGGGGAFVLTSVLFDDGSIWEETQGAASCKYVWYNNHKKSFSRPISIPFRQ